VRFHNHLGKMEILMGFLSVIITAVAAHLFFGIDHSFLGALAVIVSIGTFWSWGIMHNFATDKARQRKVYCGGFYDITEKEADSVPNWIASVNFVFALSGFILLITAIVKAMN